METYQQKYERELAALEQRLKDANKKFKEQEEKKRRMQEMMMIQSNETGIVPMGPAELETTRNELKSAEEQQPLKPRKQNNVRKCILVFRPRGNIIYKYNTQQASVDKDILSLFSIPEIKFTIAQIDDATPEIYVKGHGDDENNDYGRLSNAAEFRSVATSTRLYLYKIDLSHYNLATKTRVRWDAGQSTLMKHVQALKDKFGVNVFKFNYADTVKLCLRLTVKKEDVVQTKARLTGGALPSDPLFARDLANFLKSMGIDKKQVLINSCVDEFVVLDGAIAVKDAAKHQIILNELGTYLKSHLVGSEFVTRYRIPSVETAQTSCGGDCDNATTDGCDEHWENIYPVSTGCYGSGGWHSNSNSKRKYHHRKN
jgi:hypothetical protein